MPVWLAIGQTSFGEFRYIFHLLQTLKGGKEIPESLMRSFVTAKVGDVTSPAKIGKYRTKRKGQQDARELRMS